MKSHKVQKNNKKASILVIDKSKDESTDKENMDKIEELVTSHKIDIRNSYKNKVGKTLIICKTDQSINQIVFICRLNKQFRQNITRKEMNKLKKIKVK